MQKNIYLFKMIKHYNSPNMDKVTDVLSLKQLSN